MKIRRSLLKDQVTVQTYDGDGAYGPIHRDPITVWCTVDEKRRLVRDSNGDETVSEATLLLHPVTKTTTTVDTPDGPRVVYLNPADVFTPESGLTVNGRTTRVITTRPLTRRGITYAIEVTCA